MDTGVEMGLKDAFDGKFGDGFGGRTVGRGLKRWARLEIDIMSTISFD